MTLTKQGTGLLAMTFLALGLSACAGKSTTPEAANLAPLPETLAAAVESDLRTPQNRNRDQYRHPLETLQFFEVGPEMSVVEIWPSGGWYTEILAPYLASSGRYIIADPPADPNGYTKKRVDWMAAHPVIASKVTLSVFAPGEDREIAPAGSVDRVLTFRNVHNWQDIKTQEKAFKSFFAALKPGGVLGVVEHRAAKGKKLDPKSGYVFEDEVIRMAKKAGFQLVAKSEINANPKDTKDYKGGVWSLPPVLKNGEADREKYLAIGESDRMTLKFMKPLASKQTSKR